MQNSIVKKKLVFKKKIYIIKTQNKWVFKPKKWVLKNKVSIQKKVYYKKPK
jgi:hypothetical protein